MSNSERRVEIWLSGVMRPPAKFTINVETDSYDDVLEKTRERLRWNNENSKLLLTTDEGDIPMNNDTFKEQVLSVAENEVVHMMLSRN